MKKINLNQIQRNLSSTEMKMIMAGSDHDNTNNLMYCTCTFINYSSLTNSNSAEYCLCACVHDI